MANKTIEQHLTKTATYINALTSGTRKGHHNYVVLQAITSTKTPLDSMTVTQVHAFDSNQRAELVRLDIVH